MCSLAVGVQTEKIAAEYLRRQGLHILATNFRCKMGEIDIIAQDARHIIFVEVRYRQSAHYGSALESITPQKIMRIEHTALYYLQTHPRLNSHFSRFDIIAISPKDVKITDMTLQNMKIDWIPNAFSGR